MKVYRPCDLAQILVDLEKPAPGIYGVQFMFGSAPGRMSYGDSGWLPEMRITLDSFRLEKMPDEARGLPGTVEVLP